MEIRGVKLKKQTRHSKNSGFFVLKPPEYFCVPLLADDGDKPIRVVKVKDIVKEGTLIAKPNGRYGSYVYSPTSGKVVGVVKKLNASGNECEHIIIARDLNEEKEYLNSIESSDINQETLLKRLYESGMVDNFEPYDPAYKKYLLKCKVNSLIINCTEDDPYKTSDAALIETYLSEFIEGAKFLQTVANAQNLVFVFTTKQKSLVKLVKSHIKKLGKNKNIKVKCYPNIYPLHNSRLLAYYETGKMVPEGSRTAETSVIVDVPSNCYDFYNAVIKGVPSIQKAVTVSGRNCLRKANYFIKNGTPIEHILGVVGTKEEYLENMLIYGGIMSGIAQETLDISATLTASCILFCDKEEYSKDNETPCINCGRCVACCPVRLHVKNLDDAIVNRNFSATKKLGISACIGCGACSYVCPAKRYLAQRISFAKDFTLGKRGKKANTSEYVLLEGEDATKVNNTEDGILHIKESKQSKISEIEEMLELLNKQKKGEEGGDNNE